MKCTMINKYDYMSGKLLQQYRSITEAANDNAMTYVGVMKMLQQDTLKYPRRDFYFGYKPKKRWIVVCYDNETRLELGRWKNARDASVATGVHEQHVGWQLRRDRQFNKRYMGSTGLWFKRIVICK